MDNDNMEVIVVETRTLHWFMLQSGYWFSLGPYWDDRYELAAMALEATIDAVRAMAIKGGNA